ncbi:MAG: DNA topoisomerase (ATP-hydrolyzing) subunit A, partial [Proteobacteria bacterium]|nr:DNA topoisomerase (ATP-hydrolyzing) subunit A [Pseudomonadota bacterium]
INGSTGIAVGMATNMPPHNLGEVISACLALIQSPDMTIDELMQHIPAPDLPTAAFINGVKGIRQAYQTGRGRMIMRSRAEIIEDKKGKQTIIVTELPYMVNKARLIERIAELVKEKRIEGISALRDESDKDGMRIVVEIKRGETGDVVLNNLFSQTSMQCSFGINMVALVEGQPQLLNLKQILDAFLRHRREVVTRRTIYELRKARARAHVLEGLAVALANIDEVIELIKNSVNPAEAKAALLAKVWPAGVVNEMVARATEGADLSASRPDNLDPRYGLKDDGYHLSEVQAQAILDLKLHRLTGLEQDKIVNEFQQILDVIKELIEILSNPERLLEVIREELEEIRDNYADARRSEIMEDELDFNMEDLITEEDVVVTFSHEGYAKSQQLDVYNTQRRGGRGKSATAMKTEDFIDKLFVANTHDTLLCFSSRGKVYWLKVYQLPMAGRGSRGKPIINLLPLEEGERINAVMPIREYDENLFVFMATSSGTVKKTSLSDFSRPRSSGIKAIELRDEDRLVDVVITNGSDHIMLLADSGKSVRFSETDVRCMGRTAGGVRGMRIAEDQHVISMIKVETGGSILTATENGYGKRTNADDYPLKGRGGQGVISIVTNERNGKIVGAVQVQEDNEVMLITNNGTLVRIAVNEISEMGRNTQGVRLIRLTNDEKLVEVEKIEVLAGEGATDEDQDAEDRVDTDGSGDDAQDSPVED